MPQTIMTQEQNNVHVQFNIEVATQIGWTCTAKTSCNVLFNKTNIQHWWTDWLAGD